MIGSDRQGAGSPTELKPSKSLFRTAIFGQHLAAQVLRDSKRSEVDYQAEIPANEVPICERFPKSSCQKFGLIKNVWWHIMVFIGLCVAA
jgi:hypothetical protein